MRVNKPTPNADSIHEQAYWRRLEQDEVCVQHCHDCDRNAHPPRIVCPHCYSDDWEFQEIDGSGTVYGYTAIRRPSHPRYEEELPIVSAIIELPEGPRIMGVVDCEIDAIQTGDDVELDPSNLGDDDIRLVFDLA